MPTEFKLFAIASVMVAVASDDSTIAQKRITDAVCDALADVPPDHREEILNATVTKEHPKHPELFEKFLHDVVMNMGLLSNEKLQ